MHFEPDSRETAQNDPPAKPQKNPTKSFSAKRARLNAPKTIKKPPKRSAAPAAHTFFTRFHRPRGYVIAHGKRIFRPFRGAQTPRTALFTFSPARSALGTRRIWIKITKKGPLAIPPSLRPFDGRHPGGSVAHIKRVEQPPQGHHLAASIRCKQSPSAVRALVQPQKTSIFAAFSSSDHAPVALGMCPTVGRTRPTWIGRWSGGRGGLQLPICSPDACCRVGFSRSALTYGGRLGPMAMWKNAPRTPGW